MGSKFKLRIAKEREWKSLGLGGNIVPQNGDCRLILNCFDDCNFQGSL